MSEFTNPNPPQDKPWQFGYGNSGKPKGAKDGENTNRKLNKAKKMNADMLDKSLETLYHAIEEGDVAAAKIVVDKEISNAKPVSDMDELNGKLSALEKLAKLAALGVYDEEQIKQLAGQII